FTRLALAASHSLLRRLGTRLEYSQSVTRVLRSICADNYRWPGRDRIVYRAIRGSGTPAADSGESLRQSVACTHIDRSRTRPGAIREGDFILRESSRAGDGPAVGAGVCVRPGYSARLA